MKPTTAKSCRRAASISSQGGERLKFWIAVGEVAEVAAPESNLPPIDGRQRPNAIPGHFEGVVLRVERPGGRHGEHRAQPIRQGALERQVELNRLGPRRHSTGLYYARSGRATSRSRTGR